MKRSIVGGVALLAAVALVGCTDSGATTPVPTPSDDGASSAPMETYDVKIAALHEHHTQLDKAEGWEERVRKRSVELGESAGFGAGESFKKLNL